MIIKNSAEFLATARETSSFGDGSRVESVESSSRSGSETSNVSEKHMDICSVGSGDCLVDQRDQFFQTNAIGLDPLVVSIAKPILADSLVVTLTKLVGSNR